MSPGEDDTAFDRRGQAEVEGRAAPEAASGRASTPADAPPAGPHGTPDLTAPEATPGTGALPDRNADDEADAATC